MFVGVGVACFRLPVIEVETDSISEALTPGLGVLSYASGPGPLLAQLPPLVLV